MPEYTDLIVETSNPKMLDDTVQQLGPAVVIEGTWNSDDCTVDVRVFGDPGFMKFAIDNQGYGRVVGQREEPGD